MNEDIFLSEKHTPSVFDQDDVENGNIFDGEEVVSVTSNTFDQDFAQLPVPVEEMINDLEVAEDTMLSIDTYMNEVEDKPMPKIVVEDILRTITTLGSKYGIDTKRAQQVLVVENFTGKKYEDVFTMRLAKEHVGTTFKTVLDKVIHYIMKAFKWVYEKVSNWIKLSPRMRGGMIKQHKTLKGWKETPLRNEDIVVNRFSQMAIPGTHNISYKNFVGQLNVQAACTKRYMDWGDASLNKLKSIHEALTKNSAVSDNSADLNRNIELGTKEHPMSNGVALVIRQEEKKSDDKDNGSFNIIIDDFTNEVEFSQVRFIDESSREEMITLVEQGLALVDLTDEMAKGFTKRKTDFEKLEMIAKRDTNSHEGDGKKEAMTGIREVGRNFASIMKAVGKVTPKLLDSNLLLVRGIYHYNREVMGNTVKDD